MLCHSSKKSERIQRVQNGLILWGKAGPGGCKESNRSEQRESESAGIQQAT